MSSEVVFFADSEEFVEEVGLAFERGAVDLADAGDALCDWWPVAKPLFEKAIEYLKGWKRWVLKRVVDALDYLYDKRCRK